VTAQTFTARQVAALVAKKTGRPCDGKRVRAWAREHMARFNDDGYTTHAYTARERDAIMAALVSRSRPDAKGTAGRASSASRGRRPSAPKKPASAPKAPKADPNTPAA